VRVDPSTPSRLTWQARLASELSVCERSKDRDFVTHVLQSHLYMKVAATIATTRSPTVGVRKLSRELADYHRRTLIELIAIAGFDPAAWLGVENLETQSQKCIADLIDLPSRHFDAAYLGQQCDAYAQIIRYWHAYGGHDLKLSSFAAATLAGLTYYHAQLNHMVGV